MKKSNAGKMTPSWNSYKIQNNPDSQIEQNKKCCVFYPIPHHTHKRKRKKKHEKKTRLSVLSWKKTVNQTMSQMILVLVVDQA